MNYQQHTNWFENFPNVLAAFRTLALILLLFEVLRIADLLQAQVNVPGPQTCPTTSGPAR